MDTTVNWNQVQKFLSDCQSDPNYYFDEVLGATPEIYQKRINEAIALHSRIAVSACHDVGKSWDLARIVLWFMNCFPYSKVVTTAPTFRQVESILWSEIRAAHSKAKIPIGGQMNLTEWKLAADWFAIGLTPKKQNSGSDGQGTQSDFQGWHAPHILIIFDEATGVPPAIWDMAEGLMTSANVKWVAIANPTSRACRFYECFSDFEWHKIRITCFDSPNLIENGITDIHKLEKELDYLKSLSDVDKQKRFSTYKVVKPWLLTLQWVMGRAIKWGLNHPLFLSKVLGEFPEESDDTLIPLSVCESAINREVDPSDTDKIMWGVDVARFGSDSTVITQLHGDKFTGKKVLVKRDTVAIVGAILAAGRETKWPHVITIDETGLGAGVVDLLKENKRTGVIPYSTEIRGIQFGAAPVCSKEMCEHKTHECPRAKYSNKKAQMFDLLSYDLKRGLTLPHDEEVYLEELPTLLYSYDSKGRMVMESKDEYKSRTGRASPDHADSLALANFGRYAETRVGTFERSQNYDNDDISDAPIVGGLNTRESW